MKRTLLLAIAVLLAVTSFAQPFILTVDGFRDCKDNTKDYIVVQVPDCDKATLFQRAKNYFTITYNSPQNVMSESGTDAISILGAEGIRVSMMAGGSKSSKFSYKLLCEFKGGRVKITPVWVDLLFEGRSIALQSQSSLGGGALYGKNGKLKDEKIKVQIDTIINHLVSGLEKALTETTAPASEEW